MFFSQNFKKQILLRLELNVKIFFGSVQFFLWLADNAQKVAKKVINFNEMSVAKVNKKSRTSVE